MSLIGLLTVWIGPDQMSVLPDRHQLRGRVARAGVHSDIRRGFAAFVPLWPGVMAFAVAFAVAARSAGFSDVEILALSGLVFAGSAQVATVALYDAGAAFIPIVLATLLINLRHTLYGLSLDRWLPGRTRPPKPLLAFFLTDETYGLTLKAFLSGRGSVLFLFGASVSLWAAFISATALGVLLGGALPSTEKIGLDFVFPLTFVALLVPLLRTRVDFLVAAIAGGLMLLLDDLIPGGVTIVLVILLAATAGTVLGRGQPERTA
jgi:4-azaleucine resistance transporter AzlC